MVTSKIYITKEKGKEKDRRRVTSNKTSQVFSSKNEIPTKNYKGVFVGRKIFFKKISNFCVFDRQVNNTILKIFVYLR